MGASIIVYHDLSWYINIIYHCISWMYCTLMIHVYRLVMISLSPFVMISRCSKSYYIHLYPMYRFQWYQASELVGSRCPTGLHLTEATSSTM